MKISDQRLKTNTGRLGDAALRLYFENEPKSDEIEDKENRHPGKIASAGQSVEELGVEGDYESD